MRIFLVGYMGCGKSTLGRRLAADMGLQVVDMDTYIEERNYKTIPQIFAEEGEESFRKKEQKALHELTEFNEVVIATGGGAPCFFDNMEVMNKTGVTIFMDIDPAILADRLLSSKTERPLIKGKSRDELIAFIDESLHARRSFYSQAAITVKKPDADTQALEKQINVVAGNLKK